MTLTVGNSVARKNYLQVTEADFCKAAGVTAEPIQEAEEKAAPQAAPQTVEMGPNKSKPGEPVQEDTPDISLKTGPLPQIETNCEDMAEVGNGPYRTRTCDLLYVKEAL